MSTALRAHRFFLSLKGKTDGKFTVVDVRKEATFYDIVTECSRVQTLKGRSHGHFSYSGVYNADDDSPGLFLSLHTEIEIARFAEAEAALKEYVPATKGGKLYIYMATATDDVSLTVALYLQGPVGKASKKDLDLLRAIFFKNFEVMQIEWYFASEFLYGRLGLPPGHGRPVRN